MLCELLLVDGGDAMVFIEQDGPAGGCSLIDGKDIGLHGVYPLF